MNPSTSFSTRSQAMGPSAIRQVLKFTGMPDVISFAGGLPAPELFPISELRRAADAVLRDDGVASLQYDASEGHLPLRQWICAHLDRTVGIQAAPDRVLITNGSQQGLDLVAKVLIDPGDIVLVENPAYIGALQAFRAYEADIVGLPMDEEGVRIDALGEFLRTSRRRPKLLYLTTNFQNPTGLTTSAERRRHVAALAAEFRLPVLEDDPYGELRYSGPNIRAIGSIPEARDWLYLGTSSKILSPGMRVAWLVVANPQFYERLTLAKQSADLHTSSFTQRLVWQFVSQSELYDAHIERLRAAYVRRRDVMLASLSAHLPEGSSWTRPAGGLFLWLSLPQWQDSTELLQECIAQKVAFVPGAPFWVGRDVRNTLRLNFSNASEERIEDGIARLGRAAEAALV